MAAESCSEQGTSSRRAVGIGVAFVLLLVVHRIVIGAGFGFELGTPDADGAVATGIVEYPEDNAAYLSHAEQRRKGAWTFINSFAIEEQGRIYFNPLFVFVGTVARVADVPARGVLIVLSLLAAFAAVVGSAAIAMRIGLGRSAANWTAFLVAFGSGLSSLTAVLAGRGDGNAWVGVDRLFQDTISASVFAVYPFQGITLAVLVLVILAALRCGVPGASRFAFVWLFVWCFLSATMRPYECCMFLATHALFALLSSAPHRRARLVATAVAAAAIVPAVGYGFWVSRQEAWREYSEITIEMIEVTRSAWLIGYGLFLPAAVVGLFARSTSSARVWFSFWFAIMTVLLVGFEVEQTKLASGFQIPLAVLAGAGCAALQSRFAAPKVALASGAVIALCFVPTTVHLLANVYTPHRLDGELFEAAEAIHESVDHQPRVLCSSDAGRVLPALTATQVFAGHWSMTPSPAERREELVATGVEIDARGVFDDVSPTREAFEALVARIRPEFVLVEVSAPARGYAASIGLRSVRAWSRWELFAIDG